MGLTEKESLEMLPSDIFSQDEMNIIETASDIIEALHKENTEKEKYISQLEIRIKNIISYNDNCDIEGTAI